MVLKTIVAGAYKPTYNWGGHIVGNHAKHMTHIEAILQFQTHPYDLPEIPGYCALNLKLLGPPLGNSKGHPQIWKDPIAYHTFSQK